jgi:hypothetical protein
MNKTICIENEKIEILNLKKEYERQLKSIQYNIIQLQKDKEAFKHDIDFIEGIALKFSEGYMIWRYC